MFRVLRAAVLCAMPALLAGCGGARLPARHVELSITSPPDGALIRAGSATIAGRVRPTDAEVTVGGRRIAAIGGRFSVRVALAAGPNVIDVTAAAPRSVAALTAVRISRQVVVTVPDVVGKSPQDARRRLGEAGLIADVTNQDGVLDSLLPVSAAVCGTDPAAGQDVDRGATVKVAVAKIC